MQHETTRSRRSFRPAAVAAALLLGSALAALAAPARASADAPQSIQAASTTVLAVTQRIGNRIVVNRALLQEAPEPVRGGFISQDLIDTLSGLVKDGVHIGKSRGQGNLYVHVETHGFGGIVSLRYRR